MCLENRNLRVPESRTVPAWRQLVVVESPGTAAAGLVMIGSLARSLLGFVTSFENCCGCRKCWFPSF